MIDYWKGLMDWELKEGWVCEICGERSLIWGFVNGVCRCNKCHAVYSMKDDVSNIVDTPISQIKPEYFERVKVLWKTKNKKIDEMTDEDFI